MVSNDWITSCPSCGQRSDKGCIDECPDRYFQTDTNAHQLALSMKVHFSSGKDCWETPDDLFARYDATYHFVLDAAANELNHKCDHWLGSGGDAEDALTVNWPLETGNIWLNPPYSRGRQSAFVEKALSECYLQGDRSNNHVVCLLPARTDTKLFHDTILASGADVEFLRGRVKFKGGASAAPFPSMVVVF